MKVMKAVEVMPGEAAKMVAEDGVDCAWQGCDSHFKGDKPAGWVTLLTWWSPWPEPWRTVGEVARDPSCKANAVLTDIVLRVERGELKADPKHITELRLN